MGYKLHLSYSVKKRVSDACATDGRGRARVCFCENLGTQLSFIAHTHIYILKTYIITHLATHTTSLRLGGENKTSAQQLPKNKKCTTPATHARCCR